MAVELISSSFSGLTLGRSCFGCFEKRFANPFCPVCNLQKTLGEAKISKVVQVHDVYHGHEDFFNQLKGSEQVPLGECTKCEPNLNPASNMTKTRARPEPALTPRQATAVEEELRGKLEEGGHLAGGIVLSDHKERFTYIPDSGPDGFSMGSSFGPFSVHADKLEKEHRTEVFHHYVEAVLLPFNGRLFCRVMRGECHCESYFRQDLHLNATYAIVQFISRLRRRLHSRGHLCLERSHRVW